MNFHFLYVLSCLLIGIAVIVVLTAKFRIHAFFALLIACFIVGLSVQLSFEEVMTAVKEGFGHIMKSLGLIIVLGTTLGVILEHTGSTRVMASYILRKVGEKNAALSMSITGFVVGMPIFCDSGYIVLSGLNNSLAKRTGISMAVMAVSLATGLYSVHCLMPPHPGAASAAGIIGVDFGKLILWGILIAIPVSMIGYLWAVYAGKKFPPSPDHYKESEVAEKHESNRLPSVTSAFLPVLIPILLIAIKSFITIEPHNDSLLLKVLSAIGDPSIALAIGIALALSSMRPMKKDRLGALLQEGAEKAGGILVIIGAGGAFGAVLAAVKIGEHFSDALPIASMGLFFPFLLTFILKTAQGSSTVAIITAASIIFPLLPTLGLDDENGKMLCVLAMGAGSMMISHANDAYFWVIAKFSGLEMKAMLKTYSVATLLMGLTALLSTYILSFILL